MSTAAIDESPFLTVRQVAELLNVSTDTIYRLVDRGQLEALRIGDGPKAVIRIDQEELAAALARMKARTRKATATAMRMRMAVDD